MRIGVSTSKLGLGGGMERYAQDLINGLLDANVDTAAFARKVDPADPTVRRLGAKLALIRTGFVHHKLRDAYFSWRVDSQRKKRGVDMLVACCLSSRPDVAICGGTHRGYLAAMGKKPRFMDKRKIAMEDRQYAHARLVVAHSQRMARELEKLYHIPAGRIRLLYPPADHRRFRTVEPERREELRRHFGLSGEKRFFLFPSGGHERKGLPLLRQFFENTDLPVELLVAGSRTNPGRNIRSLGFVKDIELLFPAVDATILAPRYEPFGLVGVESVLCGTPVILPTDMGCCEVLDQPVLSSYRPGDAADLERAVREALHFDRDVLRDPSRFVKYDCRVDRHVGALMELMGLSECPRSPPKSSL